MLTNRVLTTLNQDSSYPHTSSTLYTGLACINRGADTVTLTVGEQSKITITLKPSESYSGDFYPFQYIKAVGTEFEIELRG